MTDGNMITFFGECREIAKRENVIRWHAQRPLVVEVRCLAFL